MNYLKKDFGYIVVFYILFGLPYIFFFMAFKDNHLLSFLNTLFLFYIISYPIRVQVYYNDEYVYIKKYFSTKILKIEEMTKFHIYSPHIGTRFLNTYVIRDVKMKAYVSELFFRELDLHELQKHCKNIQPSLITESDSLL